MGPAVEARPPCVIGKLAGPAEGQGQQGHSQPLAISHVSGPNAVNMEVDRSFKSSLLLPI